MHQPAGTLMPRKRRIRKLRLLALLVVLFALASASFTFGLVVAIASEIQTLDTTNRRGDVDTVIFAAPNKNGGNPKVILLIRGDESRVLITSDQIADVVKQAIVAVEDRRFYEHNGVDVRGIARALWQDVRSQSVVEGGSTITQQYVKNAYARNERTIGRKVREAALAWQLEQQWRKDRILTAYLNTIYFGNGAYGIEQAARTYFKKNAVDLTLAEAALLAGIPADPSLYDPVQNPSAALVRRSTVLALMAEQGKITPAEHRLAEATVLPPADQVHLPDTQGGPGRAPYFANYVRDQLIARFGPERVIGGGLHVTTTIDLELQKKANKAIRSILSKPGGPSAALVAIDPRDGSVRAMVGGSNFRKNQFNLATQAERQPGSAFKPFVLATALRNGVSPRTQFSSKPVEIDAGDRIWKVTNYEGSYLGKADLRLGMVSSDNAVYAQLTKFLGPEAIVETSEALGIRSELPAYFSIGLGAVAVNPLDMTRAYATLANDGGRVDGTLMGNRARVVTEIKFKKSGKRRDNTPIVGEQVLTPAAARTVTSILADVVSKGTGRRAALPNRVEAGKTGTTDNYGDAWFVGYTPELAVAVWVGYPNELKPMLTEFKGEPVSGSTLPALIWRSFMTRALRDTPPSSFEPAPFLPYEVRRVVRRGGTWRLDNGFCPLTREIAYIAGRAPTQTAVCYANEVEVPIVIGRSANSARSWLRSVPLDPEILLVPARPGSRPGVVVNQEPRGGHRSSGDPVRVYVSHAQHGLIPNLVGSSEEQALAALKRLKMRVTVTPGEGPAGVVLRQTVQPGRAAAPKMRIELVVGTG